MEAFKGKFERTSDDRLDEFLKALHGDGLRVPECGTQCTASTPVTEICEAGGEWTIRTSTTRKTMDLKFKLGEEFDEKTPDGRDVNSKVSFEDGNIVIVQKAKNEKEKSTKSVREMNGGNELIDTMTIDGVEDLAYIQKFKRVASNYASGLKINRNQGQDDENLPLVSPNQLEIGKEAFKKIWDILHSAESKTETRETWDDFERRRRLREARHARQEEKEQRRRGSRREEEEHRRRGRDNLERRRITRGDRHTRQEVEEMRWGSRREEEEHSRSRRRHEEASYYSEFPPLPSPGNRRQGAGPAPRGRPAKGGGRGAGARAGCGGWRIHGAGGGWVPDGGFCKGQKELAGWERLT